MSETKTLTIDSVEEKSGFFIAHVGNQKYGTKEAGIKNFIGKTAEFQVAMKQNGKYKNWYINEPLPEVPKETSSSGSAYDQGKRENTLIMCATQLIAAMINSAQLKDVTPSNVIVTTAQVYEGLQKAMLANLPGEEEIPF